MLIIASGVFSMPSRNRTSSSFVAPYIVDSNHVFVVNARLCKRVSNSDSRIQSPTTRHFAPMSGYLWLNIWEGFVGLAFAHMRLLFFGGIFRASGAMT